MSGAFELGLALECLSGRLTPSIRLRIRVPTIRIAEAFHHLPAQRIANDNIEESSWSSAFERSSSWKAYCANGKWLQTHPCANTLHMIRQQLQLIQGAYLRIRWFGLGLEKRSDLDPDVVLSYQSSP